MSKRSRTRAPSRTVVSESPLVGRPMRNEVTLSCGHTLYVTPHSRYANCKTLGCTVCQQEKEGTPK